MEAKDHKNRMCQREHQPRRIVLAGVCFHHTGYSDVDIEKMHTCVQTEKHTTIIAGGFNAQLALGEGSESHHVGKDALWESNKRGTRMKQWLMIPKLRGAEHEIQNKDPKWKDSLRKSTRCTMHAETTEASGTRVLTEGAHEFARR